MIEKNIKIEKLKDCIPEFRIDYLYNDEIEKYRDTSEKISNVFFMLFYILFIVGVFF